VSILWPWGGDRTRRWLRACNAVGGAIQLDGEPTIYNFRGRIELGHRLHLASRPVASHLVTWGLLRIGNDVSIGHGAAIAAARQVTIGDRTRIGPFLVLMDTDFHGEWAKQGAPQQNTSTAVSAESGFAPVEIGADVKIGSHVTVLRGAVIGDGAEIASGSVVGGHIPPGALAQGVPALVRGRAGEPAFSAAAPASDLDIPAVVMRVFGLTAPPSAESGPSDVPGWDSLGALRLLLSLEDAFGVTLDQGALSRARNIGELAAEVERARQR
jgi:acetyltransferase-like isoleucine patch superfamily enzyme/acyl carrier protein